MREREEFDERTLIESSDAQEMSGTDEAHAGRWRGRIAMISTHGYVAAEPPLGAADTGGQVVYVLELSRQLARLGYKVDIWTRRFEDQAAEEPVADGVRILRVPCGGDGFIRKEILCEHIAEWVDGAHRRITGAGLSYDFIDSHYWDAGMAGDELAILLGIPHVHTPHSIGIWKKRNMQVDYESDPEHFEQKYNFSRRIEEERRLMGDADLVVATTPIHIDLLHNDYDIETARISMIPPGYDDLRFFPVSAATRSSIRKELGFEGEVILSVGRLAQNKGYDLLIDAFSETARRRPNARLHLAVGGSEDSDEEKQLRSGLERKVEEHGLRDRVVFHSFIPDDRLADHYRAADLFVLPSRYEPFGMTTVEAMACGVPAVVTTHGGLWRELDFGTDALFADPFDAPDLGVTLAKALAYDDLRERLGREAAKTARSCYTWTNIAQQLIEAVGERQDAGNTTGRAQTPPSGARENGSSQPMVA